jgi:hypothetical protein
MNGGFRIGAIVEYRQNPFKIAASAYDHAEKLAHIECEPQAHRPFEQQKLTHAGFEEGIEKFIDGLDLWLRPMLAIAVHTFKPCNTR